MRHCLDCHLFFRASTIPIPDFSRVPSPWTTTLSDPSQPTPLPPTAALLPTSASEPEVPAASGSQPVSTARAVPAPPIWSAMRPWDPNPTRHPTESSEVPPPAPVAEASHQQPLAEHNPDVGRVPKQANCKPRQHEGRQGCNQDRQLNVAEEQAAGDQEMPEACGTQQEEEASPSAGPPTGGLSLSCGKSPTGCTQAVLFT